MVWLLRFGFSCKVVIDWWNWVRQCGSWKKVFFQIGMILQVMFEWINFQLLIGMDVLEIGINLLFIYVVFVDRFFWVWDICLVVFCEIGLFVMVG